MTGTASKPLRPASGEAGTVDGSMAARPDGDADPITASYSVFLNPKLPQGRRLLVLQHPNRSDEAAGLASPTALRLKPGSGMVEVDVPLETGQAYDRDKGLRWGRSLRASAVAKGGGTHGLAGGFGCGAIAHRASARVKAGTADDDGEGDDDVLDWVDAVRQDKVLRTMTLAGQAPDAHEVQYMVGVFQGGDLHLTPVSSLVLLRPQLHHIDAATQKDRSAVSAASKDGASATATAARAIHMTIKTAADGNSVTTETMTDRLRSVQAEPWRALRYNDENDEAAWDVYSESLFLRPDPDPDGKPWEPCVPGFAAKWDDRRMLEAVSGIVAPQSAPAPTPAPLKSEPGHRKQPPAQASLQDGDDPRRPKPRTRGGTASAASRRGGRARPA